MRNTVFIIGAGAGYDINMPLGDGLRSQISKAFQALHDPQNLSEEYYQLARAIQSQLGNHISAIYPRIIAGLASTRSIDSYIYSQGGDENIEICSKLAIAHSILLSEQGSKLQTQKNEIVQDHMPREWQYGLRNTWLPNFFEFLTNNEPFENLGTRFGCIAIINFNYDRCIEHYLFHNLKEFYGKKEPEVIELLSKLRIYHPYGKLGRVSWQLGEEPLIRFGVEPDANTLLEILPQIKTFRESVDTSNDKHKEMLDVVRSSANHVFLGFHYHDQNMELLGYDGKTRRSSDTRLYYGSALNMAKPNLQVIETRIKKYSVNISSAIINLRNDLDCAQLFDEYWLPMNN